MTAASYGLHNSFRFCHGVIDVRLIVNRVVVIIVKTAVLIELSIACHVAGDVIHPFRITADIVFKTKYGVHGITYIHSIRHAYAVSNI